MAKNDDSGSEADRRALRDALASIPPEAQRPRASSTPSRERTDKPAAAPAGNAGPIARDDEALIKHITSLGSFMTRRMDDVDHRLDELAELLESLLSSLLEFLLANLPDGDTASTARLNGDQRTSQASDQRPVGDPH